MLGLLKGAASKIAKGRVAKGFKKMGERQLRGYKSRFDKKKEEIDEIAEMIGIGRQKKKKKKKYQGLPARRMRA
jgi:hypothetical protein